MERPNIDPYERGLFIWILWASSKGIITGIDYNGAE